VLGQLLERARTEDDADPDNLDRTRGPLISQFSFTIDVREWGFVDPRADLVREARAKPEIRTIMTSDVWSERADGRPDAREESLPAE
jgi:hypothetical protein